MLTNHTYRNQPNEPCWICFIEYRQDQPPTNSSVPTCTNCLLLRVLCGDQPIKARCVSCDRVLTSKGWRKPNQRLRQVLYLLSGTVCYHCQPPGFDYQVIRNGRIITTIRRPNLAEARAFVAVSILQGAQIRRVYQ